MAGGLGRDHRHVDKVRHLDEAEVDREAMRKHERLAGRQMRGDLFLIEVSLNVIRYQDHQRVGGFGGLGGRHHFQTGGFRLGPVL